MLNKKIPTVVEILIALLVVGVIGVSFLFLNQEGKFVSAVPAAPSPTCEIMANVLKIEKSRTDFASGPRPGEDFDYYRVNLDIFEITTYTQEGEMPCDNSYIERAEQYKGYIVFVEEYNKNPILEGQKIKAKVHFSGDELFHGYFLLDIIKEKKDQAEEVKIVGGAEIKKEKDLKTENIEEDGQTIINDQQEKIEETENIGEEKLQKSFIVRIFNSIKSFFLRLFRK